MFARPLLLPLIREWAKRREAADNAPSICYDDDDNNNKKMTIIVVVVVTTTTILVVFKEDRELQRIIAANYVLSV